MGKGGRDDARKRKEPRLTYAEEELDDVSSLDAEQLKKSRDGLISSILHSHTALNCVLHALLAYVGLLCMSSRSF